MGRHAKERASAAAHQFLFATGIENSYPVITGKNGESIRRDELESTGFYEHWREDFDLLRRWESNICVTVLNIIGSIRVRDDTTGNSRIGPSHGSGR